MTQSNNEKGKYIYIYPPKGIRSDKYKLLEWINQEAKEGRYFCGSIPVYKGETLAVFRKPEKESDNDN